MPDAGITLTRVEVVGSLAKGPAEVSLVWADVLGTAWLNARPLARYLAFMFVAGVIACYGVVDDNVILIVGAMAVSPDLLPITAIGVGIVGRRPALAGRALLTLALGLTLASAAAAIFAFAQDRLDLIPSDFNLNETGVLGSLTSVSNETIAVALARGHSRNAGVGDPRQLRRRRCDLRDDDSRSRLHGRRDRARRVRDGERRRERARHERRHDGGRGSRHARVAKRAHAPCRGEANERFLKGRLETRVERLEVANHVAAVESLARSGPQGGLPLFRRLAVWTKAAARTMIEAWTHATAAALPGGPFHAFWSPPPS